MEPETDGTFVVHGPRPERWVRQTNFDNEEAVGYLADRLARLGVEDALAKKGAEPGCLVRIGTFEFDWQPSIYAGADFTPGQRGSDYRLEETPGRATAAQRLAARKARRQRQPDELSSRGTSSGIGTVGSTGRGAATSDAATSDAATSDRD